MTGNVFRVNKTRDFTVMSNHHLRNRNLSLKAKGLLSLMLSLPPEWDYSVAGLVAIVPDGKAAVRCALQEIEAQGYLRRERVRNSSGQLEGTIYEIHESPWFSPKSDFPTLEKPTLENQPQLNTKESNTDLISSPTIERVNKEVYSSMRVCAEKNTRTKKPKAIPPTLEEVTAYCTERGNDVDPNRWYAHYEANGWMVGRNKMRDWKAAVRTWESNGIPNNTAVAQPRKGGNDELLELIQSGYFDESAEEIAVARAMEEDTARRMEAVAAYMGKG